MYLPLSLRGGMEPTELSINDREAKIVAYNNDKAVLKVRLDGEISDVRIKALEVCSDISFLARRILNWAQGQDTKFAAGESAYDLTDAPLQISAASDEQRRAIEGVLSSPLAYVWGVPGAGKTSVVLAECIAPKYVGRRKGFAGRPYQRRIGSGVGGSDPRAGTGGMR